MDKNTYKELDKICLEEDYQEDIGRYYEEMFGPIDESSSLPYDEFIRRNKLVLERVKEWQKKINNQ